MPVTGTGNSNYSKGFFFLCIYLHVLICSGKTNGLLKHSGSVHLQALLIFPLIKSMSHGSVLTVKYPHTNYSLEYRYIFNEQCLYKYWSVKEYLKSDEGI